MSDYKVVNSGNGYMAMEFSGFLFWKRWQPLSWNIHETSDSAYSEIDDTRFYRACKSKSCAI